jgi:hypothetical protein
MKKFLLISGLIFAMLCVYAMVSDTRLIDGLVRDTHNTSMVRDTRFAMVRDTRTIVAKEFVRRKNYNEQICFMVDMSISSNQNRFFVFDLKKDTIRNSGLVTHGRCNEYWLEGRKYGNKIGCGCSSLGKYKIGKSYYGKFGLAYKLYGLDSSNSNAFARYVVLHSHSCVPETESKGEICQSDGCPTVAPGFLQYLKKLINASDKPILLWVYE